MTFARYILVAAFVLMLLAAWESVCRAGLIPHYLLPPPSGVTRALVSHRTELMFDTLVTSMEAIAGLVVGFVLAAASGWASYHSRLLRHGILLTSVSLKSIPLVAFAPVVLLWFGYGFAGKVVLATIVSYFPVAISIIDGLSSVSRRQVELFEALRAPPSVKFRSLIVPNLVPSVLTSLRIAGPMSVLGALIAETVGARYGLGMTMMIASANLDTALLFAAALLSSALGILAYLLVELTSFGLKRYTYVA